ncbi:calicin-like [Rhineura floridana]|uniref:calicin-like n=1 Tax=Rhineura floridana TaxID=261503 RepID=UPI002AC803F0|nr:calicin-like [Rhineura floridana]
MRRPPPADLCTTSDSEEPLDLDILAPGLHTSMGSSHQLLYKRSVSVASLLKQQLNGSPNGHQPPLKQLPQLQTSLAPNIRMQFTEKNHKSFLIQALNEQRKNQEFCDVALSVDQKIFYAHLNLLAALSPHIRSLMSSNDTKADEVLLLNLDTTSLSSAVVEEILDYFYTGNIVISEKNVEELLKGAEYFSSQTLKSHCSDFLLASLRKKNCLYYMLLATTYEMIDVENAAYDAVRDSFNYWAGPGITDFVRCPDHIFGRLLKDDNLHMQNEDQTLSALLQWVKYEISEREKLFKEYFTYLRLSAVSSKMLLAACREVVLFSDHAGPLSRIESTLSDRNQGNPQSLMVHQRKGALMDSVVVLGGRKEQGKIHSGVFAYIVGENIWLKLTEMPYKAATASATSLGKCIYVSGGRAEQSSHLKTAWKYDTDTNSWTRLPDLPIGLAFHTMVTCGGAVYSVGGSTAPRTYTSNIYKYDEEKEQWILAGKMTVPMDATALIPKGDQTIYIVTGRCLVNRHFCRVGALDCFDTKTGNVQCLTFPIQFIQKPLLSFPRDNILSIQSDKESLEINLQKSKMNKSTNLMPLLPYKDSLHLSHAVCSLGDNKVFVSGGLICPGNKRPEECSINRQAYMLDQNVGEWRILAQPPEAVHGAACCTAKLPCKILQKTAVS